MNDGENDLVITERNKTTYSSCNIFITCNISYCVVYFGRLVSSVLTLVYDVTKRQAATVLDAPGTCHRLRGAVTQDYYITSQIR